MNDFEGLKAIVTGGVSGIGEATALMLKSRGANVCVFDMVEPTNPIDNVDYVICDITKYNQIEKGIRHIEKRGLDILVNSAGIISFGDITQNTYDDWIKIFDVNVFGMAKVSALTIPLLQQSNNASIVNISSTASLQGFFDLAIYSASKGAVNSLTRAMAADYLKYNIRVNCVVPATVDTHLTNNLIKNSINPKEIKEELIKKVPIGRLISADEVAYAICYLASPLSRSTTGSTLVVDGGVSGLK